MKEIKAFIGPFSKATYKKRRIDLARGLAKLDPKGLCIIWSGSEQVRNYDSNFRFRAHSDFIYLTGFSEPDSILIISWDAGKIRSYLGLRPRDLSTERGSEVWDGERVGVERASKILGVDEAFDIHQKAEFLKKRFRETTVIYWRFGDFEKLDREWIKLGTSIRNQRRSSDAILAWKDPGVVLHEMRKIKSKEEIEWMRKSAQIASQGHMRAMVAVRPGQYEYQVAAEAEKVFFKQGSQATAYTTICAAGDHACTLHYILNNSIIQKGDLILMDAGAEVDGYASDITRCFPASGRFTEAQKEVYNWVLKAQVAAVKAVRPGAPFRKPHEVACRILSEGLSKMRIIKKSGAEIYKKELYKKYMPHGTSHWLGLDVHDSGIYYDENTKPVKLRPGHALTIEPGLYFRKNDKSVPAKYRGIGVRIEDDVVVTRSAPDVLTKDCPKSIPQIEALRAPRL
ncbi:MAG: Xaa-Pro aminopeptidase [Deltaproteobacteria bacterium CG11_big_fil_rev_8_21_14_0_20_45_16]|nr:MAG: Xaa-Pro aminopeptidase [Deltaproteobacteria bacterium CG11_big_fil_rev_8_21_14_0_20_45_16]